MSLAVFDSKSIDRFRRLARGIASREVLVLCEGKNDVDTLESLIEKLEYQLPRHVGISGCGGITNLMELAPIVSTICRISKTVEKIILIVDANAMSKQARVESLRQSLESRLGEIGVLQQISNSIYSTSFERFSLLFKIVGKLDLPFDRHEMEDYAIYLLIVKGEVDDDQISGFSKSSDFIEDFGKKAEQIINESDLGHVSEAYSNIIELLNTL